MMRLFLWKTRNLFSRVIVGLWIIACVFVLLRTLLFLNGPSHALDDAVEVEWVLMSILSYPSSTIPYWLAWPSYPHSVALTIICLWILYFVIGYIQWFVVVPWVTRGGSDLYSLLVSMARRKFGGHS